ncbi:hypothetical protein N7519_007727 [Penicillium mononematosum]|uniref:uncharacterized protein n=1 Tax=Penicillium mononematosum TaxID=268346 RepID=UPI0025489E71|nr:uncharacterized protein N7519_007727 [Penicillium mononematosum]KAJ6186426.1 hypothetical protein N7519_007727 [Penicillium mononematosum]
MTDSPPFDTTSLISTGGHVQAVDSWSGLTDPTERRRRQNRINQRACRRRKRLQSNRNILPISEANSSVLGVQLQDAASPDSALKDDFSSSPGHVHDLLEQFVKSAYRSYLRGDPAADHLLTLVKVNVFRAFMQNMQLIGRPAYWIGHNAISAFSVALPQETSSQHDNSHIPPDLRPTRVQKRIIHQPWLDLFPSPKMRDNLIEAGNTLDADELFHDIMGFWGFPALDAELCVWGGSMGGAELGGYGTVFEEMAMGRSRLS